MTTFAAIAPQGLARHDDSRHTAGAQSGDNTLPYPHATALRDAPVGNRRPSSTPLCIEKGPLTWAFTELSTIHTRYYSYPSSIDQSEQR
jgi:hypothetical protein